MNSIATSEPRVYRKKARAQQEEETRQRIVDAAIELHASEGFPGASISAIAERAGVGRVTVYRHFPDYDAIMLACTSHYMGLHPPPQLSQWEAISDNEELLRTVVADCYDYFQANEPMFTHGAADAVHLSGPTKKLLGPVASVAGMLIGARHGALGAALGAIAGPLAAAGLLATAAG